MVLEDTLKPSATFYATQKSSKYQMVDICGKLKLELIIGIYEIILIYFVAN